MPSDLRIQAALDAVRPSIDAYRSTVVAARERVQSLLAIDTSDGVSRARLELGSFGASRIDVSLFAELARGAALDSQSRDVLQRTCALLDEIIAAGDDAFVLDVAPGSSLIDDTADRLAVLGRAFGAVHVADSVRSGRFDARYERFLDRYSFEWWSRAERSVAPPLVISVNGAALHASGLADLLDGRVRLVLVIRGPSSPVPLVRLVTPGTLVLQTSDLVELARIRGCDAPVVAALVGSEAASFIHDPRGGVALWQRLTITRRAPTSVTKTIGGFSPRQQADEIAQLDALAERPRLPDVTIGAASVTEAGDPAERLAAWLLAEAGLSAKAGA
jgi:hypothetical protein